MYEHLMNEFEERIIDSIKDPDAAHYRGHLKRTSEYASLIVRALGGSEKEEELARMAGLGHDQSRSPREGHDERSADGAKRILESIGVDAEYLNAVYGAIKGHDKLPEKWGVNPVGDALILADKLFEANGAYICFRRAMYMAQTPDKIRKSQTAIKATIRESEVRMETYSADKYPGAFLEFAFSQQKWQEEFLDALRKGDNWAVHLTETIYSAGKAGKDLDNAILDYKPISETDARFKEEAVKYIKGEKTNEFMALINSQ